MVWDLKKIPRHSNWGGMYAFNTLKKQMKKIQKSALLKIIYPYILETKKL